MSPLSQANVSQSHQGQKSGDDEEDDGHDEVKDEDVFPCDADDDEDASLTGRRLDSICCCPIIWNSARQGL